MNNEEIDFEFDFEKQILKYDTKEILLIAKELVHNAFLARQAGNGVLCSSYASKALATLEDCERDFPKQVQTLRSSLELL